MWQKIRTFFVKFFQSIKNLWLSKFDTKKKILVLIFAVPLLLILALWLIGTISIYYQRSKFSSKELQAAKEEMDRISKLQPLLLNASSTDQEFFIDLSEFEPAFQPSQIDISKDNSKTALTDYAHNLILALGPLSQPRKNEVKLILKSLELTDPSAVAEIIKSQEIFQQTMDNLLTVTVPSAILEWHLQLLNNVNDINVALGYMSKVIDQPKTALQATIFYQNYLAYTYHSITKLGQELSDRGVQISDGDRLKFYMISF